MLGILIVSITIAVVVVLFIILEGISPWQRDSAAPALSVPAIIVSKRFDVQHHAQQNGHSSTSTSYNVTFEIYSGKRRELRGK